MTNSCLYTPPRSPYSEFVYCLYIVSIIYCNCIGVKYYIINFITSPIQITPNTYNRYIVKVYAVHDYDGKHNKPYHIVGSNNDYDFDHFYL